MTSSKFGQKAVDMFDSTRRAAWSMTSWFCIPEEGMKDLEVLCRSSAFLVKAKNPKFGRKYHVVTVSHCIAPWRWPNYYPDAWVQVVNEKHTHYTFEIRSNDGVFMSQVECIPRSYHHKTRDLAVLHITNEDRMINELDGIFHALKIDGEELLPSSIEITPANELEFQGHDITQQAFESPANDDEDRRIPVPSSIPGNFAFRTPHQIFAKTLTPITLGMCGGPVIVRRSGLNPSQLDILDKELPQKLSAAHKYLPASQTDRRYVYGMMDGITAPHVKEELRDKASIVEAQEIDRFLRLIEDENEEELVVLLGGQAAKHVASDPDPDKRDIHKVFGPIINEDV